MSKRIVTIVASLIAALVGGWLILAPFALGYRPAGAAWNHPTEVDFWTGVGVVVLALVALAASLGSVRAELRTRGALAPKLTRAERQERRAEAAAAAGAGAAAEAAGAGAAAGTMGGAPTNQVGPGSHTGQAPPAGEGPTGSQPVPSAPELRDLLAPLVLALLNDLSPGAASVHHESPANQTEPDTLSNPARPDNGNQSGPTSRSTPRSYS